MNTTVIIILIGCATAIALTAIICDHLFEKKTEPTESLISKKILKIHRNYIAGFLGFAVIMLITSKYGCPDNAIFTYLSFGSTITSLVLSVLAIFVTVRSSFDLYKQFGTINKVSNQIDATLNNLMDAEKELKTTSSGISSQVDNIVSEIEKRLDKRLEKTESAISEQIQKQNLDTQIIKKKKTSDSHFDATYFIENLPYNGILTLFACSKGTEVKKKFNLFELFGDNHLFCLGVIMTTRAMGYINGSSHWVNKQIVVSCNECRFASKEILETFMKQEEPVGANKEEDIRKINEYFDKIS